jgi:hypothetical protein
MRGGGEMIDEFIVTDLMEAMDDYREAYQAYDNDPSSEYGIGTWEAKDVARRELNKAFWDAVLNVIKELPHESS